VGLDGGAATTATASAADRASYGGERRRWMESGVEGWRGDRLSAPATSRTPEGHGRRHRNAGQPELQRGASAKRARSASSGMVAFGVTASRCNRAAVDFRGSTDAGDSIND